MVFVRYSLNFLAYSLYYSDYMILVYTNGGADVDCGNTCSHSEYSS